MAITAIGRYFVGDPNIVCVVTDDDLAEITTAGYLTSTAIAADIEALQNGEFQWSDTDIVLINYAPDFLVNWFKYDADNTTVTITAAQFNGMYATPKLLLAAGGANTLQVLDQLQLVMTYGTANYAAGGVAAVQYDSTANGAGVIASTTLSAATFQAAASTTFTMNPGVVALPFTTTVNKGLYLSNITGAFTTGDSAMVAHLWYRTIPTA